MLTGRINFRVQLAEIIIEVSTLYDDTKKLCHHYLSSGKPDFSISIKQDDIEFEQHKSVQINELHGFPVPEYSSGYLETLAVLRKIAEKIPDYGVLLIHGSALALDCNGILFAAKSGVGKSTHARLWREQFGERIVMVNDDKPFIKVCCDGAFLCGTPWDGKHRLGSNTKVPLRAISLLYQNSNNKILPISSREAYPLLLQQTYHPRDKDAAVNTLTLLDLLMKNVSLYSLGCNTEAAAALTAYEGMGKGLSQ